MQTIDFGCTKPPTRAGSSSQAESGSQTQPQLQLPLSLKPVSASRPATAPAPESVSAIAPGPWTRRRPAPQLEDPHGRVSLSRSFPIGRLKRRLKTDFRVRSRRGPCDGSGGLIRLADERDDGNGLDDSPWERLYMHVPTHARKSFLYTASNPSIKRANEIL